MYLVYAKECMILSISLKNGGLISSSLSSNMLCHDVHSDLAEVHVGADACRGRDARGGQNVQNDFHGELAGCKFVGAEVVGCIDEHLVDGIDMDILRRHILQVHIVDLGAGFHRIIHFKEFLSPEYD